MASSVANPKVSFGPMGVIESLNPAQARAASCRIPSVGRVAPGRPLLIIAGAGAGKTQTLAYRVARLVAAGADPERILLLTFTRRAAEAIRRTLWLCVLCLSNAQVLIERWRNECNFLRPHGAIGYWPLAPGTVQPQVTNMPRVAYGLRTDRHFKEGT